MLLTIIRNPHHLETQLGRIGDDGGDWLRDFLRTIQDDLKDSEEWVEGRSLSLYGKRRV